MNPLQAVTRRHFFSQCSMGLGSVALASLLNDGTLQTHTLATVTEKKVSREDLYKDEDAEKTAA